MAVIRIETGMAVSEMAVVRTVQQEGEQHDRHHHHGLEQHLLHVVDRGLDEVGLPEENVVGLDALRQRRP